MTKPKPFALSKGDGQPRRYVAYELLGPDGVPVLVTYGPAPVPWGGFWDIREFLPNPMGKWLKYLDKPPELGHWHCGFLGSISRTAAERLAQIRATELAELGVGFPIYNRPPSKGGRGKSRPITRVWRDGRCERFGSVLAASKATGLSRRTLLRLADMGQPDDLGAFWAVE